MAFPNLARDPFVNDRPLRRTGRALLILGLALTVFNVVLFASYLLDSADLRSRLRELRGEIAQEREAIDQGSRRLASFDLETQNQRVEFLNQRIAHRRFLWSQLFEDLGEVLPPGVRLNALSPEIGRRTADDRSRERIPLKMVGEARDSEQLLDLVDALFAHPAFGEPKLASENLSESLLVFDLSVDYLTDRPSAVGNGGEGELQTTEGAGGGEELRDTGRTVDESDPSSERLSAESTSAESTSARQASEARESAAASPSDPELGRRPAEEVETGAARSETAERRSMNAPSSRQGSPAASSTTSAPPPAVVEAAQPGGATMAGAPAGSVVSSPRVEEPATPTADTGPAPRSSSPSPGGSPEPSPRRPTPRQPDASSPPGALP